MACYPIQKSTLCNDRDVPFHICVPLEIASSDVAVPVTAVLMEPCNVVSFMLKVLRTCAAVDAHSLYIIGMICGRHITESFVTLDMNDLLCSCYCRYYPLFLTVKCADVVVARACDIKRSIICAASVVF